MKLKDKSKEELEVLSYTDLTELILKENKKPMSTKDIFTTICELLELSDEEFTNKIGDFYTSLTTDKRFVMVDGLWDLRTRHTSDKVLVSVDDEDEEIEEEVDEDEEDEEEPDFDSEMIDDEYEDDDDDGLSDLVMVDEDEIESE